MKSFVIALLAFTVVIFPIVVADEEIPGLRYLRGYTEEDFGGAVGEFLDYVPDLGEYSLDNAIKSICYNGFWLLYSHTNYGGAFLGNYYNIDYCENMSYKDQASSLRYAGSPYGLNDVYYNLYEGEEYTGAEFRGNTNAETLGALDKNVSSLIITGQSPWTFFTGLQYTGLAYCIYPTSHHEADDGVSLDVGHIARMELEGLEDNSIRSVAKGCLSKKIVRLPPLEASSLHTELDHKLANNAH